MIPFRFSCSNIPQGLALFKIDAPVKSTDPEACTQYIAADPPQYYYIWCINRPMRTSYETIRIGD